MTLRASLTHYRHMAGSDHRPDCTVDVRSRWGGWRTLRPDPACPGCITDHERALWQQLADETAQHLGDNQP